MDVVCAGGRSPVCRLPLLDMGQGGNAGKRAPRPRSRFALAQDTILCVESNDPGIAILRLQVMTRFLGARHGWLPVTPQRKEAIAAVLDEHLSEWPGRP